MKRITPRGWLARHYGSPTGAELLYVLVGAPLGLLGIVYVAALGYVSTLLLITLIGLPVLAAGLRGARAGGALHRRLARMLLGHPIEGPSRVRPSQGFVGWPPSA